MNRKEKNMTKNIELSLKEKKCFEHLQELTKQIEELEKKTKELKERTNNEIN